ncbi:hypothetical protein [Arthrobacter rhizosphaerae]|uniref:hypothetical protein n=1 Tax=Arthrobacter rhizosphaerae TaxID=2855490 RepID=UPI001FF5E039|nr:hypothetical protein [Arthrobacter rhizosphaerae]
MPRDWASWRVLPARVGEPLSACSTSGRCRFSVTASLISAALELRRETDHGRLVRREGLRPDGLHRTPVHAVGDRGAHAERASPNRIIDAEEEAFMELLNSSEYANLSVTQAYYRMLDAGHSFLSIAAAHRIVARHGQNGDRRDQRTPGTGPKRAKPVLTATAPNQLWSWDITMLLGPVNTPTGCSTPCLTSSPAGSSGTGSNKPKQRPWPAMSFQAFASTFRPLRLRFLQSQIRRGRALGHRVQERGSFSQNVHGSLGPWQIVLEDFVLLQDVSEQSPIACVLHHARLRRDNSPFP